MTMAIEIIWFVLFVKQFFFKYILLLFLVLICCMNLMCLLCYGWLAHMIGLLIKINYKRVYCHFCESLFSKKIRKNKCSFFNVACYTCNILSMDNFFARIYHFHYTRIMEKTLTFIIRWYFISMDKFLN